jgi:hypothetical protein
MTILTVSKSPFPDDVEALLRALFGAGFFRSGVLIGSWVMPLYSEIFGLQYALRTFDIDFAVDAAVADRSSRRIDIEMILVEAGYVILTDYDTGLRKFSKGGFEIEFLCHRRGNREIPKQDLKYWNITAVPLPFIDILFQYPLALTVGDYEIRIPCPEALFIHKLIVAQRRTGSTKGENDLAQCRCIASILEPARMKRIMKSLKLSSKTRKQMEDSCKAIEFPPQNISL